MQIKTIVEKDGEGYEFTADLTPEQHAFLLEFAVKTLFQQGLLNQMIGPRPIDEEGSDEEVSEQKPH